MKPFEQVWHICRQVPRGRVVTYGDISAMMRSALSAAAVGWAMRAAPKGTPWYRVVNASGGISTHGSEQRDLLMSEGVRFRDDGTIDLARYAWSKRAGSMNSARKNAKRPSKTKPTKRKGRRTTHKIG